MLEVYLVGTNSESKYLCQGYLQIVYFDLRINFIQNSLQADMWHTSQHGGGNCRRENTVTHGHPMQGCRDKKKRKTNVYGGRSGDVEMRCLRVPNLYARHVGPDHGSYQDARVASTQSATVWSYAGTGSKPLPFFLLRPDTIRGPAGSGPSIIFSFLEGT